MQDFLLNTIEVVLVTHPFSYHATEWFPADSWLDRQRKVKDSFFYCRCWMGDCSFRCCAEIRSQGTKIPATNPKGTNFPCSPNILNVKPLPACIISSEFLRAGILKFSIKFSSNYEILCSPLQLMNKAAPYS